MGNKKWAVLGAAMMLALLAAPGLAFGVEGPPGLEPGQAHEDASKDYKSLALAFGLGLAAFGGAIGQSMAIGKSVESVARQPEAGARIQTMMIIGLALIETLTIYMFVVTLINI